MIYILIHNMIIGRYKSRLQLKLCTPLLFITSWHGRSLANCLWFTKLKPCNLVQTFWLVYSFTNLFTTCSKGVNSLNIFPAKLSYYMVYRIVGKFRGQKFSRLTSLKTFRELNFEDRLDYHHLYAIIRFSRIIFRGSSEIHENSGIYCAQKIPLYSIW